MPIKSLYNDIDDSLIDIWTWFAHSPRDYPKDHSKLLFITFASSFCVSPCKLNLNAELMLICDLQLS
jgi:hypothetical protein